MTRHKMLQYSLYCNCTALGCEEQEFRVGEYTTWPEAMEAYKNHADAYRKAYPAFGAVYLIHNQVTGNVYRETKLQRMEVVR